MTDAQLYGSGLIQAESLLRTPSFGLTSYDRTRIGCSKLAARSYLQVGFEVRVMTAIVTPIM
jgi:hypothetical protein